MKRTITITFDDDLGCGWDVHEDGKCCDGLGWDEMLGQVAVLTVSPARVGNGYPMRTPQEWVEHYAAMEARMRPTEPDKDASPLQIEGPISF